MKPENVEVDLGISVLKSLQAKWVTSFYDKMQSRQDIVKKKPGKEQVSRKSLWTTQSKILLKIRFYRQLLLLLMCCNWWVHLNLIYGGVGGAGGGGGGVRALKI